MGVANPTFFLGPSESGQVSYGTFTFPLTAVGGDLVRARIQERPQAPKRSQPLWGRTETYIDDTTPAVTTEIVIPIIKRDGTRESDIIKLKRDLEDSIGWNKQHLWIVDDDTEQVFQNDDIEATGSDVVCAITGQNGHAPTDYLAVNDYVYWPGGAGGDDEVVVLEVIGDTQMIVDITGAGHQASQTLFRVGWVYPNAKLVSAEPSIAPIGKGSVTLRFIAGGSPLVGTSLPGE